jgi:hypothetical protein
VKNRRHEAVSTRQLAEPASHQWACSQYRTLKSPAKVTFLNWARRRPLGAVYKADAASFTSALHSPR